LAIYLGSPWRWPGATLRAAPPAGWPRLAPAGRVAPLAGA